MTSADRHVGAITLVLRVICGRIRCWWVESIAQTEDAVKGRSVWKWAAGGQRPSPRFADRHGLSHARQRPGTGLADRVPLPESKRGHYTYTTLRYKANIVLWMGELTTWVTRTVKWFARWSVHHRSSGWSEFLFWLDCWVFRLSGSRTFSAKRDGRLPRV